MLKDFFSSDQSTSHLWGNERGHRSVEALHNGAVSNGELEECSQDVRLSLSPEEVSPLDVGGDYGMGLLPPRENLTMSAVNEEKRDAEFLLLEEVLFLRDSSLFFLQEKFDNAYNLALEEAKKRQAELSDETTSEAVLAYRQEQRMIHTAELERREKELLNQFQEEQRRLRQTTYRRQVDALSAKQKELEMEYHLLLKQYYVCHEVERCSTPSIPYCSFPVNPDGYSLQECVAPNEEAALHTPTESMTREQLIHLRCILHRLRKKVSSFKEHARHSSSLREMELSTVAARVQQQYLSIIAEQHHELGMLQRWYSEMQQLEKEAENCILSYREQCRQRHECLQADKDQQPPFLPSHHHDSGCSGEGTKDHLSQRVTRQNELFDFLL